MTWVPLHVHSQYSILDSTASVQLLAEKGAIYGMEALALTDFCNMFGVIDFFKACNKAKIKPIIGCEVVVAPFSRFDKKKNFRALCRLSPHSSSKKSKGISKPLQNLFDWVLRRVLLHPSC